MNSKPQSRQRGFALGLLFVLARPARDRWYHTVDYGPFIESQLARTQVTLGPYVAQNWSRSPQHLENSTRSVTCVRARPSRAPSLVHHFSVRPEIRQQKNVILNYSDAETEGNNLIARARFPHQECSTGTLP